MDTKIASDDMVVYSLASAPFGVSDESALHALSQLSKKYPGSDMIKRSLARKMKDVCMFDSATDVYFKLFMRTRRREDAVGLLVCSMGAQRFDLYFLGMELHKLVIPRAPFLERIVAALESRVFEVDHEKCMSEYPFVGNEECTGHGDAFHGMYTKCMLLIQERKCREALDVLMAMFRTASIHETIEFLVQSERVELLYHLSQQFAFFGKYYRAAEAGINRKLLNIFGLAVETQSEEAVCELCRILKRRTSQSTNK